ncbi:MAG: c-type cytochrome [Rhodobacteraceae bacterium]|nr:c-type cytochrome [Paracoccaceae bacterium]
MSDDHAGTGAQLFQSCISCHEIGPDARNKVGPPLNGIIGSPAANSEGFRYSRALVARAEAGLVWDEAALDDFMANPSAFIPGTRMSFSGVRKKSDRAALLAFMATLVPETGLGVAHLEPGDPEVTPEILAIEGNVEYGKYLSATCVTCHQASGKSDGIPPIINWPAPAFVTVLHAYRSKARDNQVMQQIAGTLSDEEIAALAAYYESIQP